MIKTGVWNDGLLACGAWRQQTWIGERALFSFYHDKRKVLFLCKQVYWGFVARVVENGLPPWSVSVYGGQTVCDKTSLKNKEAKEKEEIDVARKKAKSLLKKL